MMWKNLKVQIEQRHQFTAVFTGWLSFFICGYQLGYLGPALVILQQNGYYQITPISTNAQSLMITCLTIGFIPGALSASYSNDIIGRRYSIICSIVPQLAAQLFTYFATSVYMFYVSQLLRGFFVGWIFIVVPTYISEISVPKFRGAFTFIGMFFITLGNRVVGNNMQSILSIELTSLIGIIITLSIIPLLPLLTESPYYYLLKNNETECKQVLKKLRGTENVEKEFEEMIAGTNLQNKDSSSWIQLFTIPVNFKVLLFGVSIVTIQEMTGVLPVSQFSHKIIYESGLKLSLLTISLVISTSHIASNLLSIFVVEAWGRKILFIVVYSLATIGHFLIGISLYLSDNITKSIELGVTRFVGIIIFEMSVALGLSHLVSTLTVELFPTNVKSKGCSFLVILGSILGILTVQLFQLLSNIHLYVPFCCMCMVSFIGIIFGIFFVPETKNKSLAKIQEDLNMK